MLAGIEGIHFNFILAGIIWSVALGFAAGNYACSLVHRLPRGRLLLDKTPYCGNCGTLLKVKDLFPVISALLLKHRCRYCGQKFPVSHTWTEILVGLLFVLAFLQYNFTESYLLIVTIGVFLITLAAIEINENILMTKVLVCVVIFGMMYRILQDGTVYGFFEGGLNGLFLGVTLKYKQIKKVGHIYSFPPLVWLLTVGGICVGSKNMLSFFLLFWIFWLLARLFTRDKTAVRLTIPFGFAVMLFVLYPELLAFTLPLHFLPNS